MSESSQPTRYRPRWSLRLLLIVVTLVCAYLACWVATKKQGIQDVRGQIENSRNEAAVLPLIVGIDRPTVYEVFSARLVAWERRCYYFWFFGYVAKLPYERRIVHLD